MTRSNDTDTDSTLNWPFSTTPQERSRGIFRGLFGLSADEGLVVLGLPVLALYVAVNFAGYAPGDVMIPAVLGGVFLGLYLRDHDHDHGPFALAMREVRNVGSRIRMPLLPGDARRRAKIRRIDAAADVDPDHDFGYAERADGALIAVVAGTPLNTTRYDRTDWGRLAHGFADAYDTHLGKEGTPVQFQAARLGPEGADVASLQAAAGDESVPRDARTFAAATATHTAAWEENVGVMDTAPRAVVAVFPHEAETAGFGVRRRILGATGETTAEQISLLSDRVAAAKRTLSTTAENVTPCSETELRDLFRGTWRPHDDPLPQGVEETTAIDETAEWGPHGIDEHRTHVVLSPDDPEARDVASSLWVSGTPTDPAPGVLAEALTLTTDTPGGVRLEVAIHPEDRDHQTAIDELDQQIRNVRRRLLSIVSKRGIRSGSKERDAGNVEADLEDLRDHAQDHEVEVPEVSLTFTVRGESKEDVLATRSRLATRLRAVGFSTTPADGDQLVALQTTAPLGKDYLRSTLASRIDKWISSYVKNAHLELGTPTDYDMPSGAIGCLTHSVHGVRQDDDGVIYGMAAGTHPTLSDDMPVGLLQICRDDLRAPHRCLIGASGWGKTYLESAQSGEELLRERGADRMLILDIAENFEGPIHTLGGEKVTFGESLINPWAVGKAGGVDLITELICVVIREEGEGDAPSRSRIRTTVEETFKRVERDHDRVPVFADYFDLLAEISKGETDISTRSTEREAERWGNDAASLLSLLAQFRPDGEFGFMSPDLEAGDPVVGDVPLDNRVLLFDGSEFQDRGGAASAIISTLYLTLAYRASGEGERTLCAVDEAHKVFKSATQAGRFESLVRAGRNRGLCFDFLSQADEDFSFDEALVIAKQSGVVIAGNVGDEADPDDLVSLGFPRQEAEQICGALASGETSGTDDGRAYSEAVVNVEGDVYLVQFETHPLVGAMITFEGTDTATAAEGATAWRDYMDRMIRRHLDDGDDDGGQDDEPPAGTVTPDTPPGETAEGAVAATEGSD